MYEEITRHAQIVITELLDQAKLKPGSLFVIGCSSSEMVGKRIGKGSSMEAAQAAFQGIYPILKDHGIHLAVQCCEHLNRALIVDAGSVICDDFVNAVPQPKAGGSFATAAYNGFAIPVALEHIRADAGLDIGGTLIGMHLKEVAVPLRLENNRIGEALVMAARTRPKFIGGDRAVYDDSLK